MADNGQNTTGLYMIDPAVVERAMHGDEAAFREIYDKTYRNNLYVARKYMKNDAAAEDVLQEAYIRIWTNLPSLNNPAGFVNWSRQIVANTALNELRKHQPLLFSEMNGDDGFAMELQIEDVYLANQPELAFTEKEEQEIIHEMINSLSNEQRMCVMMYYIENLSVREIAQAMGCSEGTVKSRLNYGRQNIKAKAEDLQRKGYNFKGISALAILVLLLVRESRRFGAGMVVVSAAPVTAAQGSATRMNRVVSTGNASGPQAPSGAGHMARKAAPVSGKSAATKAVKGSENYGREAADRWYQSACRGRYRSWCGPGNQGQEAVLILLRILGKCRNRVRSRNGYDLCTVDYFHGKQHQGGRHFRDEDGGCNRGGNGSRDRGPG